MNTNTNLSKKVLAIEAHPDDAEFLMAGTLTLLHQKGYNVHIASVCTGSGGSKTLNPREIASIRFNEATQSAQILDGSFETLGVPDGELVFENKIRAKVRELVRRVNPDIVITMSPNDYMPDHEITSYLTFDACFAKALQIHLYYADPIELTDKFGQKVFPEFCVDISSVIDIKEKMLSQHASQRVWLKAQHGMDDYINTMLKWSEERGKEINVKYAEGFRQHKGHPYPKDNILLLSLPGSTIV